MIAKTILVTLAFLSDGSPDRETTDANYKAEADKAFAQATQDFDTVAVEIATFLLANPAIKSLKSATLVGAIWDNRVESGQYKDKDLATRSADRDRLEEVLGNYVRANPDQFHVGQKQGIAFNFVLGDHVTNEKGEVLKDGEGNPVQRYRWSKEDWTKMTAPKPKAEPAAAAA